MDVSGEFLKQIGKFFRKQLNNLVSFVANISNNKQAKRTKSNFNNQNTKKSNSGHNNLPTTGIPNTTEQKPNGDFRVYGPDGKAVKDIDYSHPQNHPNLPNPHAHDWTWNGDIPSRGKAYDPNATETVLNTVTAVGVGYAVYRIIRILPSLSPGMWWSIPINAATP